MVREVGEGSLKHRAAGGGLPLVAHFALLPPPRHALLPHT